MLEKAGNENDIETINSNIDELLSRYRRLGSQLFLLVEEKGPENDDRPPVSEEELSDIHTAVSEFVSAADHDTAVQLIEGLREYRIPQSEKIRCDALMKAAEKVSYEDIAKILQKGD